MRMIHISFIAADRRSSTTIPVASKVPKLLSGVEQSKMIRFGFQTRFHNAVHRVADGATRSTTTTTMRTMAAIVVVALAAAVAAAVDAAVAARESCPAVAWGTGKHRETGKTHKPQWVIDSIQQRLRLRTDANESTSVDAD